MTATSPRISPPSPVSSMPMARVAALPPGNHMRSPLQLSQGKCANLVWFDLDSSLRIDSDTPSSSGVTAIPILIVFPKVAIVLFSMLRLGSP